MLWLQTPERNANWSRPSHTQRAYSSACELQLPLSSHLHTVRAIASANVGYVTIVDRPLFGLGKPNAARTKVVDRVPLPQERITQDRKRSNRLGEVHSHERWDARALDFEDVVIWGDGEIMAGQRERKIRERATLWAVHGVLAIVRLLGTDFLVTVVLVSLVLERRVGERSGLTGARREWMAGRWGRYRCQGWPQCHQARLWHCRRW